jgi:hypothetical protein
LKDQGTITLGALAGAVAGGIFAYLYFTAPGRRLRRDLEPHVTELMTEISRARAATSRARASVTEGWDSVRHVDAHLGGPRSTGRR